MIIKGVTGEKFLGESTVFIQDGLGDGSTGLPNNCEVTLVSTVGIFSQEWKEIIIPSKVLEPLFDQDGVQIRGCGFEAVASSEVEP